MPDPEEEAEGISQRKGDHRKPSPFIMSSYFTRTKTYPFYYDCPFILSAAGLEHGPIRLT